MLPFELTKDTLYLALSGELWSVFYEYFTEIDRVIKGFYCICIFECLNAMKTTIDLTLRRLRYSRSIFIWHSDWRYSGVPALLRHFPLLFLNA